MGGLEPVITSPRSHLTTLSSRPLSGPEAGRAHPQAPGRQGRRSNPGHKTCLWKPPQHPQDLRGVRRPWRQVCISAVLVLFPSLYTPLTPLCPGWFPLPFLSLSLTVRSTPRGCSMVSHCGRDEPPALRGLQARQNPQPGDVRRMSEKQTCSNR